MLSNIDSLPSIIDVSSESGEEFTVEPGDIQALDEGFRVGGSSADALSVFVGAAAATIFPSASLPYQTEEVIDTTGSQIERQLMELVEEHQNHDSVSSPSYTDTEFEESPEPPEDQEMDNDLWLNSYGRVARPPQSYKLHENGAEVEDRLSGQCQPILQVIRRK